MSSPIDERELARLFFTSPVTMIVLRDLFRLAMEMVPRDDTPTVIAGCHTMPNGRHIGITLVIDGHARLFELRPSEDEPTAMRPKKDELPN